MIIDLDDVIHLAAQTPTPTEPDSPSFWDRLWPVFLGAVFAFLFSLTIALLVQLVIVPRVEARKRREERWERDVLTLGELLTAELPGLATSARTDMYVMQALSQDSTTWRPTAATASRPGIFGWPLSKG
jgi:hypothetical protein